MNLISIFKLNSLWNSKDIDIDTDISSTESLVGSSLDCIRDLAGFLAGIKIGYCVVFQNKC